MIRRQEAPTRAAWQQPDRVVRALGLRRGQVVADLGAGSGYFSLRLARAVGPRGRVFAVEAEPEVIAVLRDRFETARARNVTPVLGSADDPHLPPGQCDLALVVNVYHHFGDRVAFLRQARRALRRRGRLAVVEWDEHESPVGPPAGRRVSRAAFFREARRAGFTPVAEYRFLPHQYFVVLRPV
jgi:ubiquinone/menaquinone biosynthesis C-methylase UbiE